MRPQYLLGSRRLYEEFRTLGCEGSYDAIRRDAKGSSKHKGALATEAHMSLHNAAGEIKRRIVNPCADVPFRLYNLD